MSLSVYCVGCSMFNVSTLYVIKHSVHVMTQGNFIFTFRYCIYSLMVSAWYRVVRILIRYYFYKVNDDTLCDILVQYFEDRPPMLNFSLFTKYPDYLILTLPFFTVTAYEYYDKGHIEHINKYFSLYCINQLACSILNAVTILPPVNRSSMNRDLIYSGHTFCMMIGMHMMVNTVLPHHKYFATAMANLYALYGTMYLTYYKYHYTVDCLLSIYIVNIFFFHQDAFHELNVRYIDPQNNKSIADVDVEDSHDPEQTGLSR